MALHIFNPEHDIALAANLANFTAPFAGRQLRHDLGFLPALWAEDGDALVVDDVANARNAYSHLLSTTDMVELQRHLLETGADLRLQQKLSALDWLPAKRAIPDSRKADDICPWGWNLSLRMQFKRMGCNEIMLPSDECLEAIRLLSHRRTAAALLPHLRFEGTVGEATECTSEAEVETLCHRHHRVMLKAPWSSSGRGLCIIDDVHTPLEARVGWLRHLLSRQGSVMVEPFYEKEKDFGMEFECDKDGVIRYLGLSLFYTSNGIYKGSLLASETVKRQVLGRYLPLALIDQVQAVVCNHLPAIFAGRYQGPFGIDMMIVRSATSPTSDYLLHPCVEINLRRTMGHVALSLSPQDGDYQAMMRIDYIKSNYLLKIETSLNSVNLV